MSGDPPSPATAGARPWLAHYAPGVPTHLEVPPLLVPALVQRAVERWGRHEALIFYGARWSYDRLWEESGRFAAALARDGVGPGDRVALYLPNCPGYPVALLGILRLGAVAVQVSPLYQGQDLGRIVGDAEPKAIVTLEILYPNVAAIGTDHPVPLVYLARLRDFYPWTKRPFVNLVLRRQGRSTAFPRSANVRPYRTAVRTPGTVPEFRADPATTVAVLQYTGGTTGLPKGAMLTHRNLVANILQGNAWNTTMQPGAEVILASIPFFHIYGLTVALLLGLSVGGTIVLQTRPDVPELLKLIDRYQPTQFPGVPALYQAFVQRTDLAKYRLRSIRYCLSGSAPLPVALATRFEELTGARLTEGYGLSETSPVTHVNPLSGERRAGSIGIPVAETDQKIVDPDRPEQTLPVGQVGELCVRGPQVMLGYYHQPDATRSVLRDGWFLTGDLARADADGFVYLIDRKKDLINVGGMKAYPREIEETLLQHPAVLEAAVVGVPDAALGEVPKAFVVLQPGGAATEAELIDFVRARIAHFKAPRSVEFRTSLPRSGVQKVLRRTLRAEGSGAPPTAPGR